jgi:hypothetical protein
VIYRAIAVDYPPLDAEVEGNLRQRLLPEVDELEELLNRDLAGWKGHGHRTVPTPGAGMMKPSLSL